MSDTPLTQKDLVDPVVVPRGLLIRAFNCVHQIWSLDITNTAWGELLRELNHEITRSRAQPPTSPADPLTITDVLRNPQAVAAERAAAELDAQLRAMSTLAENWDSYGAQRINADCINRAIDLLDTLPADGWQAVPCSDGSVQLEQHRNGIDIEILISLRKSANLAGERTAQSPPVDYQSFQQRALTWMHTCFQRPDSLYLDQRSFRFLEEAIELGQSAGTSKDDVLRLVEYVYSRKSGAIAQEIGGVMVTLAGLASAAAQDVAKCAEAELQRCIENTEKIRAKDLAKPQRSPLPGNTEVQP